MQTPFMFATGTRSALHPGGARTSADRESPDVPRRGRFEAWPSRLSTALRAVAALVLVAVFSEEAAAQCTLPTPPGQAPPAVSAVTVEARIRSLRVFWDAVTEANRYVVQWKSGSEGYNPARGATVSGTSYTIGGLTPGIEHTVRVFAARRVNLGSQESPEWVTACSSASSDEGTPIAPPSPPLGQVTGVRVEPGVESLGVTWRAVDQAGGYKVQWRSGNEDYDPSREAATTVSATNPGTSYTITGLTPGTSYTLRVIATRAGRADGPPSAEASGTPLPPPLGQVTGVRVEPGVESLGVTWRAVDQAGGYKVQWRSGNEDYDPSREAATTVSATNPGTSYTITGLTPGTSYTLRVIATRAGRADGPPSAEASGTPLPPPLGQVTGVRVEPGVESLGVTWRAVDQAGGYKVQWRSGNEDYDPSREAATTVSATNPGTSYTITGLTPGTSYTLRVIATRAGRADGPPSAEASGTPLPPPLGQVTGVRVEPGVESLGVTWRAVDQAGGYKVQWRSGNEDYDPSREAATTVSATNPGTSYTITGLTPGTSYTLRVIATRAGRADGPPSDEATMATLRRIFVSIARETSVVEGSAAELSVQLSESFPVAVAVTWITMDGSAKAGEDYRAETAGRLTFEPGDRMGTLRVRTLDDPHTEPAETFRVRLTEASNAELDPRADSATVTITDDDTEAGRGRALGKVLAAAGRWIAADAVRVVGGRFTAPAAGARSGFGARALAPAEAGPWTAAGYGSDIRRDGRREGVARRSAEELLARSWFDVPLGTAGDTAGAGDASTGWRLWARGTAGGFDERPEAGFRMDGEVAGGYLGLDHRSAGGALAGVAISHARSDVDYAIDSVGTGEVDLELTSVLPYAHFSPRSDLGVWGLLGAGWGSAGLKDEAGEVETDVKMRMAAAGLRQEVAAWPEIDATVKADAFLTRLEADAAAGLPKTAGGARQLRLGLEGRRQLEVSPAARMIPSLEIGGRWDGGDAGKGVGVEVGGGLAYSDTALGLEVEARGWFLLAHQEKKFDEWGGNLTVKLDPGQAGRGPWVTFAPGWGAAGSRALQTWNSPEAFRADGGSGRTPDLSPDRLELEVGYGTPAYGGLLTPHAGLSITGSGTRRYRLGARLDLGGRADLGIEGRRSMRAGGSDTNEIMIYGRVDW